MPNPHDKPVLTRDQLRSALAADRVFTFDPPRQMDEHYGGANIDDFPYIVFAEGVNPKHYRVADGWRINFKGEVYPGHITPVPIVLREVSHIDFADPQMRGPLLDYVRASSQHFAGFANEETMRVAQVLCSSSEAWDHLLACEDITEATWHAQAMRVLRRYAGNNRRLFGSGFLSLHQVDWHQVAAQFELANAPGRKPTQNTVTAPASNPIKPTVLEACAPEPFDKGRELPTRGISAEILDVLKQARAEGAHIYLPALQLDRKLYTRVDEVLRALGGKWIGGSRRAHRFECDAEEVLYAVLTTGRFTHPSDLGFFPTPAALINKLLIKARLDHGMQIIEPEAGTGGLACAAAAAVGGTENVTVCELMERNVRKLQNAGFAAVHHGDFLRMVPDRRFSASVMNPPFSGGQDIEHVLHASRFIVPGGTVTSYMSRSWMHASTKKAKAFREFLDKVKADVEEVEAGAFRSSGTEVATTLVHFHV